MPSTSGPDNGDDALILAKLAMTYLGLLENEWHELGDDERRDLVSKAKEALLRLGAALERDRRSGM